MRGFEDSAHGRGWLPLGWHPDHFDLDGTNAALAIAVAEPVAITGELAELAGQLDRRGIRLLREILGRPFSHGPTDVTEADAARLTETYRIFLDVIGDGVTLTADGYLPPAVVEQCAERSGITGWWFGKANREDLTPPVAEIRDTMRALGLVRVRKGRLAPTAAAARCREDPVALWRQIVGGTDSLGSRPRRRSSRRDDRTSCDPAPLRAMGPRSSAQRGKLSPSEGRRALHGRRRVRDPRLLRDRSGASGVRRLVPR